MYYYSDMRVFFSEANNCFLHRIVCIIYMDFHWQGKLITDKNTVKYTRSRLISLCKMLYYPLVSF